jgi:hypothetical protein
MLFCCLYVRNVLVTGKTMIRYLHTKIIICTT